MLGETLLKDIIKNPGEVCRYTSCKAKFTNHDREPRAMSIKPAWCWWKKLQCTQINLSNARKQHIPIMRQWPYIWQFKKALLHEFSSLTFPTSHFSNRRCLLLPCPVGISSSIPLCHSFCFHSVFVLTLDCFVDPEELGYFIRSNRIYCAWFVYWKTALNPVLLTQHFLLTGQGDNPFICKEAN